MKKTKYKVEKENGQIVIKGKKTKAAGFRNFSEARNFLKFFSEKKLKKHQLTKFYNL